MAINLTTLFNRLGGHYGIAKTQIDARSAIVTRATNLDGQFDAASRYMYTPVLNEFLSINTTTDATLSNAKSGGIKTLTEMVNADNPSIQKSTLPALVELNRQFRAQGKYLLQNTITQGAVTAGGTNVGNGTVLLHGIPSQMSRSETLYFTCISDTTTGSAEGAEVFRVTSSAEFSSFGDSRWPGGTGLNALLASSDYGGSPNLLANGTFDNWTGAVPDNWTTSIGISKLTSGAFRSPNCIQFTNTGAPISITQSLGAAGVGPGKRLVFGVYVKKISGSVSKDIDVRLETSSGSSYAVLTIPKTSITTSWTRFTSSYQHPWTAPQETAELTVFMDSDTGCTLAFDCVYVFAPTQMGTNGQYAQIIAGADDWRIGDYFTVTITNNYASNVLGYTERFFAPFANGIELPTAAAGANTIDNTVIP